MLLHPGAAEPGAAGFPGSFRFCFPKRFGKGAGGAFYAVATLGSGRYRLWQKKREKPKTLNGRSPLEDSSVFDDPVLVLIVMT